MGFGRACAIELDQQCLSFQSNYLPHSKNPSGDILGRKLIILGTSTCLFITTLVLRVLKLISPLSTALLCLDFFFIGYVAVESLKAVERLDQL